VATARRLHLPVLGGASGVVGASVSADVIRRAGLALVFPAGEVPRAGSALVEQPVHGYDTQPRSERALTSILLPIRDRFSLFGGPLYERGRESLSGIAVCPSSLSEAPLTTSIPDPHTGLDPLMGGLDGR